MSARAVSRVVTAHRQTEGGGFTVRRPLPTAGLDLVDPFLLLDEMGPVNYAPGEAKGAPDHPHRGFETVTYLLSGEFVHEDSSGARGQLSTGDVQWMTAGSGVVHSEMPSARVREAGGRIHGFQIWVNLPRSAKMSAPRYQDLRAADIPHARSEDGLADAVVVAGTALGVAGAAQTHTPITYVDWTLQPGAKVETEVPADQNAMIYVFGGSLQVGDRPVLDGQLAVLGAGDRVGLSADPTATEPARALLLGGRPLREPVARYGPFVMNTREEIVQAFEDYQSGRMGAIAR
jgi:redox-sensitive bicupin YhaK (pirin superfamily)